MLKFGGDENERDDEMLLNEKYKISLVWMGGSVSIRGQWSWSVVRSPFSVLSVLFWICESKKRQ